MTDYKAVKLIKNGVEYCFPTPYRNVELLAVAGGGSGGGAVGTGYLGGGGGAGGVIYEKRFGLGDKEFFNVEVGGGGQRMYLSYNSGQNGDDTALLDENEQDVLRAYGGGGGGGTGGSVCNGCNGGSGGGGAIVTTTLGSRGCAIAFQGTGGGAIGICSCSSYGTAGGGGGAGGGPQVFVEQTCMRASSACGGWGITSNITGANSTYAVGGSGATTYVSCCASAYGGSNTSGRGGWKQCIATYNGCNGIYYGSGGGGMAGFCAACGWSGAGCRGIMVIRYHTDGSDGITNAIGGCKYECGDYTIHCYNYNGIFVVNPQGSYVNYLVVGGGGGGCRGGGGGGAVCCGGMKLEPGFAYPIVVGDGGTTGKNGGKSSFNGIVACGGKGGCSSGCSGRPGGNSGSGCTGGCSSQTYTGGGGAGATGNGMDGFTYSSIQCGGTGGRGYAGYGGGGGGGTCVNCANCCFSCAIDGGGHGISNRPHCCADAINCGGGGGGAYSEACAGYGACGVVDICYPCDGSYGFSCATGGDCCYLCGDMCVHRFISNGTFTIIGPSEELLLDNGNNLLLENGNEVMTEGL